jgi:hypothetical protein
MSMPVDNTLEDDDNDLASIFVNTLNANVRSVFRFSVKWRDERSPLVSIPPSAQTPPRGSAGSQAEATVM